MTSNFGRIKLPKGKTANEKAKEGLEFPSMFKDGPFKVGQRVRVVFLGNEGYGQICSIFLDSGSNQVLMVALDKENVTPSGFYISRVKELEAL